ncbi:MAG: hypothetical protein PHZ19_01525 [Candidatus Thermoplasmatota archaeon]|nr:hypothetical protein [Candidatus Thermoplasmatota archaeon]
MPTYICPECGAKTVIGLEVSVGGEPKHECPKCGAEMVKQN